MKETSSAGERLDEIKERWEKASPGPYSGLIRAFIAGEPLTSVHSEDKEALSHASDDIAWFLSEISSLRAEIARLKDLKVEVENGVVKVNGQDVADFSEMIKRNNEMFESLELIAYHKESVAMDNDYNVYCEEAEAFRECVNIARRQVQGSWDQVKK